MKNRDIVVTFEYLAGMHMVQLLHDAVAEASNRSITEWIACALLGARKIVEFNHNGVLVRVAADSPVDVLYIQWERAIKADKEFPRVVGPYAK